MFTDLVTGDVPGASGYFNPLMRQTIIPCTSGTHPTSPHEGMHAYETDTDRLIFWNGSSWQILAGGRSFFTPTLTAASVNPTLGTGSERYGLYTIGPGPLVTYNFFVKFGSAGVAAGTGGYSISLPVTAANIYAGGHNGVGSVQVADSNTGVFAVCTMFVGNGATTAAMVGAAPITNAFPWTWAAGDYISGTVIYPMG